MKGEDSTPLTPQTHFLYDPDNGFEEFESESSALITASDRVQDYIDDAWIEGVDGILVGEITHRSTQIDLKHRPEQIDDVLSKTK